MYVLTVLEVLEKHQGNSYSLEMLSCSYTQYKCSIVPVDVNNAEYWDHVLSKYGDDLFLYRVHFRYEKQFFLGRGFYY